MDKYLLINAGTKKQRHLVHEIAWWVCDKYFNRFKSWNIEIDLEKIEGKVQGWCMHIDGNACHVTIDKRLKGDDFITCVFHELTHIEQHLRNKFGINDNDDKIHYLDKPYEIDAYIKQEQLLEEYRLCS